ncbi:MAG: hypothetical protein KAT77_02795 [Nanoarchaeota archaeon]|nr:hypothetical protein [Nanoarchaeota archaeon]
MKITICGSIAFFDEILKVKQQLEALGHEVKLPPTEIKDKDNNLITVQEYYQLRKTETNPNSWVWDRKAEAIKIHFNKIKWADAVLITNYEKNNIKGYIGANTFLEMGIAFHLNKKIFLLNQIPEVDSKEEILGMKPIVLQNLEQIEP